MKVTIHPKHIVTWCCDDHYEEHCEELASKSGEIARLRAALDEKTVENERQRIEVERLTHVYYIEREEIMRQRDDAYEKVDKTEAVVGAAEALIERENVNSLDLRTALAAYRERA